MKTIQKIRLLLVTVTLSIMIVVQIQASVNTVIEDTNTYIDNSLSNLISF